MMITKLDTADVILRRDNILHINVKVEFYFEMEHLKPVLSVEVELTKNKSYSYLHTAPDYVIPSQEVMQFLASQKRSELVVADAFVVTTLPQLIVANSYRNINKPIKPSKVFNSKEAAIQWLKEMSRLNKR